jgi:hypothetical protein
MAIGTPTAILLGAAALGGTAMAVNASNQADKKSKAAMSAMQTPGPTAPSTDLAAQDAANELAKRKRTLEESKTLFTSPLGIGGQAQVARKTLTGQ